MTVIMLEMPNYKTVVDLSWPSLQWRAELRSRGDPKHRLLSLTTDQLDQNPPQGNHPCLVIPSVILYAQTFMLMFRLQLLKFTLQASHSMNAYISAT